MKKAPSIVVFSLVTTLASIALVSVLLSTNSAFAMGDNPSSCINRYDAKITHMKINNGLRTIDPIAHPNADFSATIGKGYTVTFTIHSAGVSSLGSTNVGSVWYGSTASGKAVDQCVNGVNPNTDIMTTMHSIFMSQATHGTLQPVEWHYWPLSGPTVTYTVHWD